MKCRECNAELPHGAHRCRHCGRPILHEKIWNNKRLRALFIGIIIVLIAVGAGFAVVASQDAAVNRSVKDAICNFQFDTAETRRHDVKLFPAGDNDLRTEIIRTGRLYQAGQYTQTLMYIDDLHENYADSELVVYSGVLDAMEAKSLPQIYAAPQTTTARRIIRPRWPSTPCSPSATTPTAPSACFSQTPTCAKACSSSRLHPT